MATTTSMHLSQSGLDFIKSFEGYLTPLPDGSCRAYRCPANVLTIGWGCTEGVTEGLIWTRAQAEEGIRREMLKHEATVKRLVTVELNQNQFDALTSFTYNCGGEALASSTLLKKLNAGDQDGAAKAFHLWNKGGGKVLPGLVRRRQRESVLFLTPMMPPQISEMPQKVEASAPPVVEALRGRTVLGQLFAIGGLVVTYLGTALDSVTQIALDSVAQITKLEGVSKLSPGSKALGTGILVLGIGTAIYARLDAAKKGKTG